jgi:hypothetical protein
MSKHATSIEMWLWIYLRHEPVRRSAVTLQTNLTSD